VIASGAVVVVVEGGGVVVVVVTGAGAASTTWNFAVSEVSVLRATRANATVRVIGLGFDPITTLAE
jgi:gamma-glutamylcysteine synthetase